MSSNTSNQASSSNGPAATPSRTSPRGVQRTSINKNWLKDEKTKTAKCKVCNTRITKFSHQCGTCSIRICSDCTEPDGANSDEHKAVARDYIDNGCWCGFKSKFNPAFKDRMPAPVASKPAAQAAKKKASTTTPKRKRGQAAPTVKNETPSPEESVAPAAAMASPEDPFKVEAPAANQSSYSYVALTQTVAESSQAASGNYPPFNAADDAQEPAQKKRKSADSSPKNSSTISTLTELASVSPQNPNQQPSSQQGSNSSDEIVVAAPPPAYQPIAPQASRTRRATRANPAKSSESPETIQPTKPTAAVNPSSSSQSSKSSAPKPSIEGEIVIIGAGIFGMFTALKLAQKNQADEKKQKITVVDINAEPFALASGHSAGFLTTHGSRESWDPLMVASIDEWNDLLDDKEVREAVRFDKHVYTPTSDAQARPSAVPWFRCSEGEFTTKDRWSKGTLSPAALSAWLQRRCHSLGVDFRFNAHPKEIKRDGAGNPSVILQHVDGAGTAKPETLVCSDLVLAAGAFTPALFAQLFPGDAVKPSSAAHIAQWVRFEGVHLAARDGQGVVILHPGEAAFRGPVAVQAVPARAAMVVSGASPVLFPRRLRPHDALSNPLPSPEGLRAFAAEHLEVQGVDVAAAEGSYVCSRPVLGRVGEAGVRVFAACGFGMSGFTLAAGVGRVMAEMVRGEASEVDVGCFGVGAGYVGKGKGRAV